MVTPEAACVAFQVAVQRPSFNDSSASAGSPEENVAVTLPDTSGFPQSSTTVTSIAVGQATAAVKPVPSSVKTGRSWAGAQLDACGLRPGWAEEILPAGKTSSRTSIWNVWGK